MNGLSNVETHEGRLLVYVFEKKKILIAKLLFYLMLEKVDVVKDTKLEHLVQFSMNLVLDQYLA